MAVVQRRNTFIPEYRRLKRQRNWLVQLDRLFDPVESGPSRGHDTQTRPTRRSVQRHVGDFLADLELHALHNPQDAKVVAHICATIRQRWPRLFACYAWPERYRTNNAMETFFGRLRTRQRQIHGRKSVHEFILRYGEWAAFIDPDESFDQLLYRLQSFDQTEYDEEFDRFLNAQRRLQTIHRFRHQPKRCLKLLERQWSDAVRRKSQKS